MGSWGERVAACMALWSCFATRLWGRMPSSRGAGKGACMRSRVRTLAQPSSLQRVLVCCLAIWRPLSPRTTGSKQASAPTPTGVPVRRQCVCRRSGGGGAGGAWHPRRARLELAHLTQFHPPHLPIRSDPPGSNYFNGLGTTTQNRTGDRAGTVRTLQHHKEDAGVGGAVKAIGRVPTGVPAQGERR